LEGWSVTIGTEEGVLKDYEDIRDEMDPSGINDEKTELSGTQK